MYNVNIVGSSLVLQCLLEWLPSNRRRSELSVMLYTAMDHSPESKDKSDAPHKSLMALSGLFLILEVFYSCRGIKLLPDKSLQKSGSIPIFSMFALKIWHSPIVFICPRSVSHANLLWKKHLKSIRVRFLVFISRHSWITRENEDWKSEVILKQSHFWWNGMNNENVNLKMHCFVNSLINILYSIA